MRRFLDGYYPMRVSLKIQYPTQRLQLVKYSPLPQAGLTLLVSEGDIRFDAWFEGRLHTQLEFCDRKSSSCPKMNN